MKTPVHPMDQQLKLRGWQRARLDDLAEESKKLPGRLICVSPNLGFPGQAVMAIIDVHLWLVGDRVRMDLATPIYPPFLETLVVQGIQGQSPIGMGLTPCLHFDRLWNPLCLPLIWQQSMNDMGAFHILARRYEKLIGRPGWQCPDYWTLTM